MFLGDDVSSSEWSEPLLLRASRLDVTYAQHSPSLLTISILMFKIIVREVDLNEIFFREAVVK